MRELKQEQKEKLKGCYFIFEEDGRLVMKGFGIYPAEVTRENFRAFWYDYHNNIQELNVDDFSWSCDRRDFYFAESKYPDVDCYYINKKCMPVEVVKLLDDVNKEKIIVDGINE